MGRIVHHLFFLAWVFKSASSLQKNHMDQPYWVPTGATSSPPSSTATIPPSSPFGQPPQWQSASYLRQLNRPWEQPNSVGGLGFLRTRDVGVVKQQQTIKLTFQLCRLLQVFYDPQVLKIKLWNDPCLWSTSVFHPSPKTANNLGCSFKNLTFYLLNIMKIYHTLIKPKNTKRLEKAKTAFGFHPK